MKSIVNSNTYTLLYSLYLKQVTTGISQNDITKAADTIKSQHTL
jgi:hypothetical protein